MVGTRSVCVALTRCAARSGEVDAGTMRVTLRSLDQYCDESFLQVSVLALYVDCSCFPSFVNLGFLAYIKHCCLFEITVVWLTPCHRYVV
jgi:hypothetical protein